VVRVVGTVRDTNGRALAGALVEIWQACIPASTTTRGSHTATLDPDFQYWGRTTTDAGGNYSF